jgi:hypothetical protein
VAIRRRCVACGLHYAAGVGAERARHASYHADFLRGPRAGAAGWRWTTPASGDPEGRIVRVRWSDSRAVRGRVHRVARIAAKAAGFDRAGWPAPDTGRPAPDPEDARAYLYLRGGRALGLAVFRRRYVTRRATVEGPAWTPAGGGTLRWTLDMAWTAPAAQGSGLAQRLVAAALADLGVTGDTIAYLKPFTAAGVRLARRLAGGDEIWLG